MTETDNKGVGRFVGAYSAGATHWRKYDAKGRVWIEYQINSSAPYVETQYRYDAAGNVVEMIYPSGRRVSYARDAMGRIASVTTRQNAAAAAQTVVSGVEWDPYGSISKMNFGYGATALFTRDSDYRLTRFQVGVASNPGGLLDRSFDWTGDTINSIADNRFPDLSQTLTYTPTRRLATAQSFYGAYAWTYDANGNRLTETRDGVASAYAYPAGSNRLSSVTPAGQTARSFSYDYSGSIIADSRTGALGMSFSHDAEGRLIKAWQTNAPAQGGTYAYDAFDRLVARVATNGATTTETHYVHDLSNRIIAETDASSVSLREYIWLDDLPVAVVDKAETASPILYYAHADHLGRPYLLMYENWTWIWTAQYTPFGAVAWEGYNAGFAGPMEMRFPGQWFQLESGLAYNWHRHYDATIGRYLQPDPIGYAGGRNLYGYVGGNPLAYVDPNGFGATGAAIGGWTGGWLGGILGEIIEPLGGAIPGRMIGSQIGRALGDWGEDLAKAAWANENANGDKAKAADSSDSETGKKCPPKPDGVPDDWIEKPSKKKGGKEYVNPKDPNDRVRFMPGDPDSPYPHQQKPYVVDQNGGYRDVNGNQIPGPNPRATPEAHIPYDDFVFRR